MGLFDLFRSDRSKAVKSTPTNNFKTAQLYDFEKPLAAVLDILLEFKDAYLQVGDRMYVSFVIEMKKTEHTNSFYTYEYFFKMRVFLSDWWDNIMIRHKEIGDCFENVFNVKEGENSFICNSVDIGSSTCCMLDWDKINHKLQRFLDRYEAEHSGIKFDRSNGGAGIKFGS